MIILLSSPNQVHCDLRAELVALGLLVTSVKSRTSACHTIVTCMTTDASCRDEIRISSSNKVNKLWDPLRVLSKDIQRYPRSWGMPAGNLLCTCVPDNSRTEVHLRWSCYASCVSIPAAVHLMHEGTPSTEIVSFECHWVMLGNSDQEGSTGPPDRWACASTYQ